MQEPRDQTREKDQPGSGETGQVPGTPPRSRRRWRALLALSLSSFLGLFLLEFGARWHSLNGGLAALDSLLGTELAADGQAIQRVVPDPVLGFWRNPAHPSINSLGLRGGEDMRGPRDSNRLRLLVLGDSVAYPPGGFVARLQTALEEHSSRPVEILNGAIHGYTTYQERLYLERVLPHLDVDLVLLQYCLNDNYDFLHHFTEGGQMLLTLEAKSHLFPEEDGWIAGLTRRSYLVYGVRKALYRQSLPEAPHPWQDRIFGSAWRASTWPRQGEHLRAMGTLLEAAGVSFAVMAVPHESQLSAERRRQFPEEVRYPQEQLRRVCEEAGIPYLDLLEDFTAAADRGLYTDGIHLSDAGHELCAGSLLPFVLELDGLEVR